MSIETTALVFGWITMGLGLLTLLLGGTLLVCLCWTLALDWCNRLCARTAKTYGGWRELEKFKDWQRTTTKPNA